MHLLAVTLALLVAVVASISNPSDFEGRDNSGRFAYRRLVVNAPHYSKQQRQVAARRAQLVKGVAAVDAAAVAQVFAKESDVFLPATTPDGEGSVHKQGPSGAKQYFSDQMDNSISSRAQHLALTPYSGYPRFAYEYAETGKEVGKYELDVRRGGATTRDRGKYVIAWKYNRDANDWYIETLVFIKDQ